MNRTQNKNYNLVEKTDTINNSLDAWNFNFNKIDSDITAVETALDNAVNDIEDNIESTNTDISVLSDNYDLKSVSGNNIHLTDSASTPIDAITIGKDTQIKQDGEPTPENPVDIQVTEGNVSVNVFNRNMLNIAEWTNSTSPRLRQSHCNYTNRKSNSMTCTANGDWANVYIDFPKDYFKKYADMTCIGTFEEKVAEMSDLVGISILRFV